jgi:molecular chaperone DnaK
LTNVDGTVDAALRLVGRRFSSREAANARRSVLCPLVEGPNGDVQVRLRNKSYSTTEILSFLLSDLKASAEDSLGESIEAAVISCPATFYDAQRRAIKSGLHGWLRP